MINEVYLIKAIYIFNYKPLLKQCLTNRETQKKKLFDEAKRKRKKKNFCLGY